MKRTQEQYKQTQEELERYRNTDFEALRRKLRTVTAKLQAKERCLERYRRYEPSINSRLEPLYQSMNQIYVELRKAQADLREARYLENQLNLASSKYGRKLIHEECDCRFGEGSPGRVIYRLEGQIGRWRADLEKLHRRIEKNYECLFTASRVRVSNY